MGKDTITRRGIYWDDTHAAKVSLKLCCIFVLRLYILTLYIIRSVSFVYGSVLLFCSRFRFFIESEQRMVR